MRRYIAETQMVDAEPYWDEINELVQHLRSETNPVRAILIGDAIDVRMDSWFRHKFPKP